MHCLTNAVIDLTRKGLMKPRPWFELAQPLGGVQVRGATVREAWEGVRGSKNQNAF